MYSDNSGVLLSQTHAHAINPSLKTDFRLFVQLKCRHFLMSSHPFPPLSFNVRFKTFREYTISRTKLPDADHE
jgi:hypothetical protein